MLAVLAGIGGLVWQVVPDTTAGPTARDVSAPPVSAPAVSAPGVAVPEVSDPSTVDPTTPPDSSTPQTPGAPDGRLAVSPQRIELGSSGRAGTVVLTNTGDGTLR